MAVVWTFAVVEEACSVVVEVVVQSSLAVELEMCSRNRDYYGCCGCCYNCSKEERCRKGDSVLAVIIVVLVLVLH